MEFKFDGTPNVPAHYESTNVIFTRPYTGINRPNSIRMWKKYYPQYFNRTLK